jgi:hypothetical protein
VGVQLSFCNVYKKHFDSNLPKFFTKIIIFSFLNKIMKFATFQRNFIEILIPTPDPYVYMLQLAQAASVPYWLCSWHELKLLIQE